MKVEKITTSVLTNVYYIHINKDSSRNTVYRIDRNEDLTKVDINSKVLGNMRVMRHEDRLIYEDKITDKLFITSPNKQLIFNLNNKVTFLGIDRNDIIYMGELNGDKIAAIIHGKINENTSGWKKINIDSPIGRNNLYFSNKSEVLINDVVKGSVKNLTTGEEIEYKGKLIQIKDNFIATIDSNRNLVCTNFNK